MRWGAITGVSVPSGPKGTSISTGPISLSTVITRVSLRMFRDRCLPVVMTGVLGQFGFPGEIEVPFGPDGTLTPVIGPQRKRRLDGIDQIVLRSRPAD